VLKEAMALKKYLSVFEIQGWSRLSVVPGFDSWISKTLFLENGTKTDFFLLTSF